MKQNISVNFSNSNFTDISHQQILKEIGLQTDKQFKTFVPVRSKAVQTNKSDFANHGLLANVACSPFGSPWKVTVIDSKASPVKHGNAKEYWKFHRKKKNCHYRQQEKVVVTYHNQIHKHQTKNLLHMDPRVYLGILPERISFIHLLSNKFSCDNGFFTSHDAVCLILRKIRLNESFVVLGYELGISSRQACRIFN
uniref:Uncharacterized protein n=1 Tax=Daphnia galeata TaxID=27404 RepID=A0A8J2WTV4_9CRUS|nr:unnamed protein product [Daphnia galeata]